MRQALVAVKEEISVSPLKIVPGVGRRNSGVLSVWMSSGRRQCRDAECGCRGKLKVGGSSKNRGAKVMKQGKLWEEKKNGE